jgi:hypothetical protein
LNETFETKFEAYAISIVARHQRAGNKEPNADQRCWLIGI